MNGFERLPWRTAIVLIQPISNVPRLSHLQSLKDNIQWGLKRVVSLSHFPCADQLQHHLKALLIFRRFIVQKKHERLEERTRHLVPVGFLRVASLRRGAVKQDRDQLLNVCVVSDIAKRVVAVAALHTDKIQNPDLIAFFLQQIPCCADQLSFRVEHHEAGICVHQIGNDDVAGLARAAAADHRHVQIVLVLPAVQPDGDILRQDHVFGWDSICIVLVELDRIAPFGRTVFFSAAVIAFIREVNADQHHIQHRKGKDSPKAVLAKLDLKRVLKQAVQALHDCRKSPTQSGSEAKPQPDHQQEAAQVEREMRAIEFISLHELLSAALFGAARQ